ncbi:ankyrin repeat domain-containing protein [Metabacillus fastidiosus]|uniref:ankyrin repeat domain-containing protein n=1 Tax=Metabacillus fastidiosus TaxID=1458 RepID=UPI002E1E8606|nr:ankyrin repeat domain-containing protein [Metabacillus fastidiosus]MED4455660.1 ankyrin repeat domain-containing protein [Metabacillus fastidiosus]
MLKRVIAVVSSLLIIQGCSILHSSESTAEFETENNELIKAVELNDIHKIKKLISNGTDLNTKDLRGRTPLMIATYNNEPKIVKLLIQGGADVNLQDDMENNPFLYAAAEGYTDIVKLTIRVGADPSITDRYGGTALIPAAEHGYVDIVKEILTHTKVDVNHVNNLGWTALIEAIILNDGDEKQQKTVQLLIDHGANVNIPDNDNITPLQHTRNKNYKEIEQILLKAGAK